MRRIASAWLMALIAVSGVIAQQGSAIEYSIGIQKIAYRRAERVINMHRAKRVVQHAANHARKFVVVALLRSFRLRLCSFRRGSFHHAPSLSPCK
jgi:membrane protein YqaA with SNARE-associated domain